MKTMLSLAVVLGLTGLIGCDRGGGTLRDTTMADVTANATGADGKPLSKAFAIFLQPTGDTNGAKLEATEDGKFTGKAAPGKYVFYVKMAKGDAAPKGVPLKYTEPSAENAVEVTSGKTLDIKLSN